MTRDEENQLIEIAPRWQWICGLLEGNEVSDFALSFPEVRRIDDLIRGKEVTKEKEKEKV